MSIEASDSKSKAQMMDPARLRGIGEVWYDASKSSYYRKSDSGPWVRYSETQFRTFLKTCGFRSSIEGGQTASQIDRVLVSIHFNHRLDFAGEVAGYEAGVHSICGSNVLVTRGPRRIVPEAGPWDTIRAVLEELLESQCKYLYSWIKASFESLEGGHPWRPGQMLAVAGPAGSGKSLLQNLITEILGGRSCKPFKYLTGKSDFNSTFFSAEHWMIEDEASSTDIRVRRYLGSMIKNAIVNGVQCYHAKGVDAISVTPYLRLTMTLNDNPESLMVLPPLDEDIADKIILLKATPITCNEKVLTPKARAKFWAKLISEIPAFLHYLSSWEIPSDIRDRRYGVSAWHHPALVQAVDQLSPEARLLNLIDASGFWTGLRLKALEDDVRWEGTWNGTAFELETALRARDKQGETSRLLSFNSACGVYLARLSRKQNDRVVHVGESGHKNVYLIYEPKPR